MSNQERIASYRAWACPVALKFLRLIEKQVKEGKTPDWVILKAHQRQCVECQQALTDLTEK